MLCEKAARRLQRIQRAILTGSPTSPPCFWTMKAASALCQRKLLASTQKQAVSGVGAFVGVGVAEFLQKAGLGFVVFGGHLQANQNLAVIGALVTVVKQADIPAWAHGG